MIKTIIGVFIGLWLYNLITPKEDRNAIIGLSQLKDYKGNKITRDSIKRETQNLIEEAEEQYHHQPEEVEPEEDDGLIEPQMLPIIEYQQALPGTEFAFYGDSYDVFGVLDIPEDAKHLFRTGATLQDKHGKYTITQTDNGVVGANYKPVYCHHCGKEIKHPFTPLTDTGILPDCKYRYCRECAIKLMGHPDLNSPYIGYYDGFFIDEVNHKLITMKDNPDEFYVYLERVNEANWIQYCIGKIDPEKSLKEELEKEIEISYNDGTDVKTVKEFLTYHPVQVRQATEIEYLKHASIAGSFGTLKGLA